MQRTLLFKIIAIVALMLAIYLPMALIQGTIQERSQFRQQAVDSIAADSVKLMPASCAPNSSNSRNFSLWSGHAG